VSNFSMFYSHTQVRNAKNWSVAKDCWFNLLCLTFISILWSSLIQLSERVKLDNVGRNWFLKSSPSLLIMKNHKISKE
jgi:hypothetical protein